MQNHEVFEDIFTQFGGIHQKKDKKIFEDIFNQIAGTINETTKDKKNINKINFLLIIAFNAFASLDNEHYNKQDDGSYLNSLFPQILNEKFDLQLLENIDFSKSDEEIQKQFIKIALCKYEKKKFDNTDTDLIQNTNNIYHEIINDRTDFSDMKNKISFIKFSFILIKKFCNITLTTINYRGIISNYLQKYYTKNLSSRKIQNPYRLNIDQTDDEYQKRIDKLQSEINTSFKNDDESVINNNKLSYNNNVEALLTIFLLIHCICFDKIIFIVIKYYNILEESKDEMESTKEFLSDLQKFVELNFNDEQVLEESVMKIIEEEIKRDEYFLQILENKLKK